LRSIGTAIIELLIFIPLLGLAVFFIEESENFKPIIRFLLTIFPISVYLIYLIFSNTKYISLSCLLLKYRVLADDHRMLRIIISNIIFYGLLGCFFWLQADHAKGFFINNIRFLLLAEFGGCFIPKIRTRISLYLLKIKWESVKKAKR
jgi:hypothetical protein